MLSSIGSDVTSITTDVAAPARVPRSATDIYVLWMTLLMNILPRPVLPIPEKSALSDQMHPQYPSVSILPSSTS